MADSAEQSAIIHSPSVDLMLVTAYAGTGKSYTLKQFCRHHKDKSFLYFVYNKSMRIDAQKSFKGISNVTITTFHGLAFRVIGVKYKERLDKEETLRSSDLVRFVSAVSNGTINAEEMSFYTHALLKTLRDFTSSSDTVEGYIEKHKQRASLDTIHDYEMLAYVLPLLRPLWKEIIKIDSTIPFEHDFYLKIFQLKKPKMKYVFILIDEAQDISHVMIDIIMTQTHASKIYVGDPFQSIYSFRGAVNSLEYLEENYNPSVYLLSKSFRCPPKVASLANRIIKMAGAKIPFVGVAEPAPVGKQVTYIARTNSGLFDFCADNIDKKILFVGGIKSYNFSDILDVKNLMSQKHEYIRNDFIKSFPDFKELLHYSKQMQDISLMGTIGIVLKYMSLNLYDLIKTMKECATTSYDEAEIVITTAHKSKGLEWAQVELLNDFPFASETKMENVNVAEELRLLYVAVTRAMNNVKLPIEILEYLEVSEKEMDIYAGKPLTSSILNEVDKVDDKGSSKDDNDSRGIQAVIVEEETLFAGCRFCGGEIWRNGNTLFCKSCDFKIDKSKIERFYFSFGANFDEEKDKDFAMIKMCQDGGHTVKGLVRRDGKKFTGQLTFGKSDKYGWGVAFAEREPIKTPKRSATRSKSRKRTVRPRPRGY